jgi:hypothetical protein
MLGWKIFKHAFRMVFHDLGTAIRVSSPIIAVSLLGVVLFFAVGADFVTGQTGNVGGVLLLALLNYVAALWVAVSWHRYCLLEEYPEGMAPEFNGSRVLAYFGWAFVLGLIVLVMFGGVGGLAYALGWPVGAAVMVVGFIFALWVTQRLSLVLPASAVNNPLSIGDSWQATAPVSGAILVTFTAFFAFAFVIGFVGGLFSALSVALGFLVNAVVQWIITMMGLSILTTFYGICVEKRELT